MDRRQVKCIKSKIGAPRAEYITHVGGDWGPLGRRIIMTEAAVIWDIENNIYSYFVRDKDGDEANVVVRKHNYTGKKYLTTDPDNTAADNLSVLPQCT